MKVKYKNNHEETWLEHHYSLAILKNRPQKIFEMPMMFVFTHYLCKVDLVLKYILIFRVPKSSSYNIVKCLILQIKSNEEEGDKKQKIKTKTCFHSQEKGFLKKST